MLLQYVVRYVLHKGGMGGGHFLPYIPLSVEGHVFQCSRWRVQYISAIPGITEGAVILLLGKLAPTALSTAEYSAYHAFKLYQVT